MKEYESPGPSHEEIIASNGLLLLDFGANGCGYCQAAAPAIADALAELPNVQHIKIEDGRGRPLGRSFGVKLWPTLIALKDGQEIARVVRPESSYEIRTVLAKLN